MADLAQIISLVLMAVIVGLVLWALFQTTSECHAVGGTVVRGLTWLECIK